MDAEIAVLRLLHILPGAVWVGSAVFLAWVVQPALAKTGPPHAPALMANMLKPLMIVLHGSAITTIVFGLFMAFRVPGRQPLFDHLWSTDWGTMIWLGFAFSIVAYGIGNVSGMTNKKMGAIGKSLTGPPTPEQVAEMSKLRDRGVLFAKIASIGVLIAVGCMALARYV
ncbi:MAG: hypothetical protein HOF01_03105 [Chloroflexi bacterium]|jgi:hypothetical protein|nr:hypothetical protein [Chloroflexota bacterium]